MPEELKAVIVFSVIVEFDRPDFVVGLYLYNNLTELNIFGEYVSTHGNVFSHHSTAVVSHTLIQFGVYNKQVCRKA